MRNLFCTAKQLYCTILQLNVFSKNGLSIFKIWQESLAMLNSAGEEGNGSTDAFTAGAVAKTTRAVMQSQVRAVNTSSGHLLCPTLQATHTVSLCDHR